MKQDNVFIMGDSYSTFYGYIPKGYAHHYSDGSVIAPIHMQADETWWKLLENELNWNIVVNDSWSGSTICKTGYGGYCPKKSFIGRLEKYFKRNFFEDKSLDLFLVFGGTNDCWSEAPLGELMYENHTEEDLKCVLPGFCYLLKRMKEIKNNPRIIVIINTLLKPEVEENYIKACNHYGIEYLQLEDIDKFSNHPTVLGMRQIADQVKNKINY